VDLTDKYQNTGKIYSPEAYSDKLESTRVRDVPSLMSVELNIVPSKELAERESRTN
jgi:hypothetical protein